MGQKGKKCVFVCFGMWVTSIMHLDNKGNEPTYLGDKPDDEKWWKMHFSLRKNALDIAFFVYFWLILYGFIGLYRPNMTQNDYLA